LTAGTFSVQNTRQKQEWVLSPKAFETLLNWLGEGSDSQGVAYLEMRRRLVGYFDRKNCAAPEELADETLNRVARRIEEEGSITSDTPAKYCYIVARFVFLEYLRARKSEVPINELVRHPAGEVAIAESSDEQEGREKLLSCLERCVGGLPPTSRDLILRYYCGEQRVKIENRRALAQHLEISINALAIRACRIREKLEACVKECLGATEIVF
jgi:DNA-directed RNA polymerase specialized sigma24 family protein